MGTIDLDPYISFRDDASDALDFYQSILGGTVDKNTFGESGMAADASEADKIMHGLLETEDGLRIMAADTPTGMTWQRPAGVSISLSGTDHDRLHAIFDGLANGGTIVMPLEKAPWGDEFGMLTDQFGVSWMIDVASAEAQD